MRARERAGQLEQIRLLRDVQRLLAEKGAAEASQSLTSSRERLDGERAELTSVVDSWRASAELGGPCDPAFRFWAAALVQQVKRVDEAEGLVADTQALQEVALEQWAKSLAMSRLADEGYRTVKRRVDFRLGAVALDDATDLFVSLGRVR